MMKARDMMDGVEDIIRQQKFVMAFFGRQMKDLVYTTDADHGEVVSQLTNTHVRCAVPSNGDIAYNRILFYTKPGKREQVTAIGFEDLGCTTVYSTRQIITDVGGFDLAE